jgi:ammonia channel protein AmtB
MPGTGDDDYYLWNAWMVGPWLICGGWMSVILAWGLYVVAMGNAPFTERNALKTTTTSSFLLRPLVELSVATAGWVLLGWAMVDGGDTRLFVGTHQFATVGTPDYALWFFQLALLFVAVAVVSNACTSKRIDGPARVVVLLFYALAVFSPLFHWLWSQWGWASPYRSVFQQDLLLDCGVVDTAGASVIHLSAGTAGLVLLWLLGDRHEATAHRAHALKHRDAFTSTAAFANVCGPLFVWVGFVGLHVSTNLPQVPL